MNINEDILEELESQVPSSFVRKRSITEEDGIDDQRSDDESDDKSRCGECW